MLVDVASRLPLRATDRPPASAVHPRGARKKRARLPASLSLFDPICTPTVPEPAFPYGMAAVLAILPYSGECFKALNGRRARKRVGWAASVGPRGRGSASGGTPHGQPIPADEPTSSTSHREGRDRPFAGPAGPIAGTGASPRGISGRTGEASESCRAIGTGHRTFEPVWRVSAESPGGKTPLAASDSGTRIDNPGKPIRKIASA